MLVVNNFFVKFAHKVFCRRLTNEPMRKRVRAFLSVSKAALLLLCPSLRRFFHGMLSWHDDVLSPCRCCLSAVCPLQHDSAPVYSENVHVDPYPARSYHVPSVHTMMYVQPTSIEIYHVSTVSFWNILIVLPCWYPSHHLYSIVYIFISVQGLVAVWWGVRAFETDGGR